MPGTRVSCQRSWSAELQRSPAFQVPQAAGERAGCVGCPRVCDTEIIHFVCFSLMPPGKMCS